MLNFERRPSVPASWLSLVLVVALTSSLGLAKGGGDSEASLTVELSAPLDDVLRSVREVSEDQIIHGTYSYEKEKTLYGANASDSPPALRTSGTDGQVFYKVAEKILAPRFFKDSGDIGSITVRYIVQSLRPDQVSVRIDAAFLDARHALHRSQGAVEAAELDAVKEHLANIQAQRRQDEDAAREIQRRRERMEADKKAAAEKPAAPMLPTAAGDSGSRALEQKIADLRRQVERRVIASGTPLKASPFRNAATIASLSAGSDVIVVIVTPYWYGVETEDGHRGWIHRSLLEPAP